MMNDDDVGVKGLQQDQSMLYVYVLRCIRIDSFFVVFEHYTSLL
jgi:hypothetical protein